MKKIKTRIRIFFILLTVFAMFASLRIQQASANLQQVI